MMKTLHTVEAYTVQRPLLDKPFAINMRGAIKKKAKLSNNP